MGEEENKMTCAPDYEAYYEEYRNKYNQMCEMYAALEAKFNDVREQKNHLEAQMEVVRLIFGG